MRFAWQIIAGVGYNISDNIELGLKYRYFSTKFGMTSNVDDFLDVEIDGKVRSHSHAGEPDLQLRLGSAAAASATAAAAASAAAATGDADVPGRFGDPGDGRVSAATAAASASAGAGTRLRLQPAKQGRPGSNPGPFLFGASRGVCGPAGWRRRHRGQCRSCR